MGKRYLIRTNISPFSNPTYYNAVKKNVIRGNSGNLLFPYSLIRSLMTDDDTVFDCIDTGERISQRRVDKINSSYDAFLIPLANAFRADFVEQLNNITALVKRLTIPCVVIGIGYQGDLSGRNKGAARWADDAKRFCDAVLEKSDTIGIRGEITAEYLNSLGLEKGVDYQVIGCPSMYMYGEYLPKPKPLRLSPKSRIHINSKVVLGQKLDKYLHDVCEAIPDHYFLPQNKYDIITMYTGLGLSYTRFDMKSFPKYYPADPGHHLFTENRVRGFITVPSWFDFLRQGDLNFGTRIHGNIAAVLAGIPAFIIAPDSRVLELAEYHSIPHMKLSELDNDISIFELLEDVDFDMVLDGHIERFKAYMKFMDDNGLESIFVRYPGRSGEGKCPFDKRISGIDFRPPIVPYEHLGRRDKAAARLFRSEYMLRYNIKNIVKPGWKGE